MRLIDYIVQYMQDGTPRRLVHIAQAVKAMGCELSITTQYVGVYQVMIDYPHLFKQLGDGMYQIIKANPTLSKDQDQIKEMIVDLLREYPKMSPVFIWKHLQDKKVVVSFSIVQCILDSDSFVREHPARYSNRKVK
jgi:hypothetical protein